MTRDPNDVVRVYAGPLMEVEAYQQVLADSGIESNVVGTSLMASFGSAIPDSIELWVHQGDMEKAIAAITLHDQEQGRRGSPEEYPHPTDEARTGV